MPRLKLIKLWSLITVCLITLAVFWPFIKLKDDLKIFPREIISEIKPANHLAPTIIEQPINADPENILVFGGDIMLSRTVNAQIEKFHDYTWPLKDIADLFSEGDLAIANLESPFLITKNYSVLTGSFSFKANPKSAATLTEAGFDVLSLANNHMLNQGAAGLKDTENILQSAGISYTGREPENLVVKESHGIKFGFLAYTYAADSTSIANMLDSLRLKNDIKEAKDKTDVVIVMMHAGTEYTSAPNRQQIDFAHQAIDSGADLVIGSHPHWIQSVEKYQGKTIIYSLGNLVFDQMWSPQTSIGLVAKTYFKGKELDRIEYIPVEIKNYGQTEIMPDGAEKSRILKFLNGS